MRTIRTTVISILALGLLAGSAVGVAAQDEADPMASSTFTAQVIGEPELDADPATGLGTMVSTLEATDPRASGTWTQYEAGFPVDVAGGDGGFVGRNTQQVVNDGGSWVGTARGFLTFPADGPPSVHFFSELVGEGGYEGLTMYFVTSGLLGEAYEGGVIVPSGQVPAFPELPAE